jgi:hypothetical protein
MAYTTIWNFVHFRCIMRQFELRTKIWEDKENNARKLDVELATYYTTRQQRRCKHVFLYLFLFLYMFLFMCLYLFLYLSLPLVSLFVPLCVLHFVSLSIFMPFSMSLNEHVRPVLFTNHAKTLLNVKENCVWGIIDHIYSLPMFYYGFLIGLLCFSNFTTH